MNDVNLEEEILSIGPGMVYVVSKSTKLGKFGAKFISNFE